MTGRGTRWALRLAYIGVLALATLTPFNPDWDLSHVGPRLLHAFALTYTARDAIDAARNVALFAGWGALWVATSVPAKLGPTLRAPTIAGCLLSITAETTQLILPERNSSILDVLTNTTGSWIGAATIVFAVLLARAWRERKSYVGVPALLFATAYGVAVTIDGVFPLLRVDPLPGAYGGPFSRLAVALDAFSKSSLGPFPVTDVFLFLPLGTFAVTTLVEAGHNHAAAALKVSIWGVMLAVIVELLHGPLGLPIQLAAILAHVTGVTLGAAMAARWVPGWSRVFRGVARPAAVFLAYALLMATWEWRPFVLEGDTTAILSQLSFERLVPLSALAWRVDLFSVANVATPFFLYFPLGGLLAVWPLRNRGWLSGWAPAAYIALLTELGQIFIVGRYFDGTEILVQWAGAGIGWAVIRRAGFPDYGAVLSGMKQRIDAVNAKR